MRCASVGVYSLVHWNWFSDVTRCTWVIHIQWRQGTDFTAPGWIRSLNLKRRSKFFRWALTLAFWRKIPVWLTLLEEISIWESESPEKEHLSSPEKGSKKSIKNKENKSTEDNQERRVGGHKVRLYSRAEGRRALAWIPVDCEERTDEALNVACNL